MNFCIWGMSNMTCWFFLMKEWSLSPDTVQALSCLSQPIHHRTETARNTCIITTIIITIIIVISLLSITQNVLFILKYCFFFMIWNYCVLFWHVYGVLNCLLYYYHFLFWHISFRFTFMSTFHHGGWFLMFLFLLKRKTNQDNTKQYL